MKYIMIALLALPLWGCHTSAEIEGDGYRIRTDTGAPYGGGHRHCPPGHAKKGWC